MTKNFKFALLSIALAFGAALISCSNEGPNNPLPDDYDGNLLLKSPEMLAYSSGHVFSNYGSRAEDEVGEPQEHEYVSHNDVEINLALNDVISEPGVTEEGETFNKDYISSHLSIHVRTPRDVKVRVDVPVDYYCEADDMAIVKRHLEEDYVYGDQEHTLSIEIGGNTVTVTVEYDENGFTITTAGINEEVIAALAEEYKDGLTFEIWNYYNTTATREQLQALLNNSTVEFVDGDSNVDYYVNAFNELRTADDEGNETSREANPWDCTVSIVATQLTNFTAIAPNSEEYFNDFHGYNGSNINKVFKHNTEEE